MKVTPEAVLAEIKGKTAEMPHLRGRMSVHQGYIDTENFRVYVDTFARSTQKETYQYHNVRVAKWNDVIDEVSNCMTRAQSLENRVKVQQEVVDEHRKKLEKEESKLLTLTNMLASGQS